MAFSQLDYSAFLFLEISDNHMQKTGGTSFSGEQSIEGFDGFGHCIPDALESLNDCDIRPIATKLPERYERGEFHPHIHFTVPQGRFGFSACCGVFMNAQRFHEIYLGSLLRSGADDGQLPMLVKAVHVMKDEQGMMRTLPLGDSVVWLQRLDECAGGVTDSLYFSVERGEFIGSRQPISEDWKLNNIGISGSVSGLPQKLPDQIVKRGAVCMQNFTDEDGESRRDLLPSPKVPEFLDAFGIAYHDFAVSPFIQKPLDFYIKILDVLIGPLESFPDPL
ncbi:MAG TPA: hypothetical protein VN736_05380 [Candidatus Limnocylindrales bacterium]|nr:hypothetical protein [Candidatus Limnocylindrales bacterium]